MIRQAPFTFVLLLILAIAFVSAFFKWFYSERMEVMTQRLEHKDGQLTDYRERLKLVPTDQTSYSRLTNKELRERAASLVGKVRQFLRQWSEQDMVSIFSQQAAMSAAKSEEERNQIWHSQTKDMGLRSFQRNAEYDRRFKVETVILRDEMLSRLPSESKDERSYSMYEHPTNPIGMGMVTDDLERLAKVLP